MSERSDREHPVQDPAGRPEPYVQGPTGPTFGASELRGDPGAEGDRGTEGGAVGGVIAGTAAAGPIGGAIGGVVGATIGSAADSGDDQDEAAGSGDPGRADPGGDADLTGAPGDSTVSNQHP
jgi:hypothetical protein